MPSEYEAIVAQLDQNVTRTAEHLDTLLDDYEVVMDRLRSHNSQDIPHETSAVIRSLESFAAEALQLVTLLCHRLGDHAAARRAVKRMRRLESITVNELRPSDSDDV